MNKFFKSTCLLTLICAITPTFAQSGSPVAVSSEKRSSQFVAHQPTTLGKGAVSKHANLNAQLKAQVPLTIQGRKQANSNEFFWIYDASVVLSADQDADGYYNQLSLEFDADTAFNHADVYAILYLGVGDTFTSYYTTSVFHIDGDTDQDSLIVDSELISGFPSRDYEILIELYDADTQELVAVYDGQNDSDLVLLPIESFDFETIVTDTVIVISDESGGSVLWGLPFMIVLVLRRILSKNSGLTR